MSSLPRNLTAYVQNAIDKCEWLRATIDPSRESIGTCKGFFPAYGSPPTSFFAECALPVPPDPPGLPPGWPPSPPLTGGRGRDKWEGVGAESASRERSRPRSPSPEPQLNPIPISDGDNDRSPLDRRQWQRSRSRDRAHPAA